MLAKNPGFAVVAVLLLALGIGAGAVIFSALDAVLLRPLPVRNPEQLVRLVQRKPRVGTRSSFSQAYFEALRDHSRTLGAVFGDVFGRRTWNWRPRSATKTDCASRRIVFGIR